MIKKILVLCTLSVFVHTSVWGQTCNDIKPVAADFVKTTVVPNVSTLAGFTGAKYVMEMAFTKNNELFFAVKEGHIGFVDNASKIHMIHKLAVWDQKRVMGVTGQGYETGLRGIAVDPDFETNRWIYVIYDTDKSQADFLAKEELSTQVVRLTFDPVAKKILANSERTIISWISNGIDHVSGSMTFGPEGVLHILSGDDTDSQSFNQFAPLNWAPDVNPSNPCRKFEKAGSRVSGRKIPAFSPCVSDASRSTANTNDLRGKTLRIKPIAFAEGSTPTPGVGTTYTIPEGNLFPIGTAKARPEIYTMGHRAGWRLNVDALTKWVYIGEGGPASSSKKTGAYTRGPFGHEELNIAHKASFFGWPYFNGNNEAYRPWDFAKNEPLKDAQGNFRPHFDNTKGVTNESPRNTGLKTLPIAKPPAVWQSRKGAKSFSHPFMDRGGCVISSGPRYYYHLNKASTGATTKLPPYYHRKLFFSDTNGGYLAVATIQYNVGKDKVEVTDIESFVGGKFGGNMLDLELSPNGELYGVTNGIISKIAYKGTCRPPNSSVGIPSIAKRSNLATQLVAGANTLIFFPKGKQVAKLFTLKGQQVWSVRKDADNLRVPSSLTNNLYYVRFE